MRSTGPLAIATGTRADWGLLLPLVRELAGRTEICIVASAMHLDPDLGHTVDEIRSDGFEPAALVRADGRSATVTASSLTGHSDSFRKLQPRAVVILGDRTEMLGAATAAMLEGIPVIHIAGGTVSEGAFDDSIRHAITKMSTLHLPETESCAQRIIQMGEDPAAVKACGALGVYNVISTPLMAPEDLERSIGFCLGKRYIIGTLHAATLDSISPQRRMGDFLEALKNILDADPDMRMLLTYPNNDVDPTPQIRLMTQFAASRPQRVCVIPSLGRLRYLSATARATAVIGNSSSGIVEIPSTGVPVVDIGCRQAGRECSKAVIHCKADTQSIIKGIKQALDPAGIKAAAKKDNPYHFGDTPRLMADAIFSAEASGIIVSYPRKIFHTL